MILDLFDFFFRLTRTMLNFCWLGLATFLKIVYSHFQRRHLVQNVHLRVANVSSRIAKFVNLDSVLAL